jgi:hypothetical protein
MLLTGDLVSGEEAQRLGLILEAHPPEQLLGAALKLAGSIAAAAPAAVAATLAMLREQVGGRQTGRRQAAWPWFSCCKSLLAAYLLWVLLTMAGEQLDGFISAVVNS